MENLNEIVEKNLKGKDDKDKKTFIKIKVKKRKNLVFQKIKKFINTYFCFITKNNILENHIFFKFQF